MSHKTILRAAISTHLRLQATIAAAGMPPHTDYWCRAVQEAKDQLEAALRLTALPEDPNAPVEVVPPVPDPVVKIEGLKHFATVMRFVDTSNDQYALGLKNGVITAYEMVK